MSELPALSGWEAGRVLSPLNDPLCLLCLAHWCFVTAAAETHTSSGSVQSKPSMALSFSRKPWSPKASEILFSPHPVTLRFRKKQDPRDLRVKSTHCMPRLSVFLSCLCASAVRIPPLSVCLGCPYSVVRAPRLSARPGCPYASVVGMSVSIASS